MTRNIVVGVDGSDNSFVALAAAAKLAEQTDSRLSVVFVRDPGVASALSIPYEASADQYVEQGIAELEVASRERTFDLLADRPLAWTFDAIRGTAAAGLIATASTLDAALIVVGGRGHSLLGGLILGSVAQKLVRVSPISVLVVRHDAVNEPQAAGLDRTAR